MVGGQSEKSNRWRYVLLSALLASASALPAYAAASSGEPASGEIIVTATKREENLQKVPVSIQALTPTVLAQHQVASFDDYVKLLPSASFQSFGPGQSQLYFRGITSGGDGLHSGSEPGTGVYIDEVPVTTIANGVDLHIYDIARVEALSGPQGTLFGASSLSGTLRIITNQPDPHRFSAGFDLQGDTFTHGGSLGGIAEGFVNIPLGEKAAIRLVGFDEHDGGYIDAVHLQRTFALDTVDFPGAPATLTEDNSRFVKKDYNTVDSYGGRVALKVDLDDNWTVTPGVIYQHQRANGNFLYNPKLGDLQVAPFAPELNVDTWYQSYLTIQGKIGDWDVLYAGGYFGRTVDNRSDYSYYAVAYDAAGSSSYVTFPDGHGGFLDPDQQFTGYDKYTKQTHEFRVTSPSQYRLRGVGGIFWQRQTDAITANYIVPGLGASGDSRAIPGAGDDIFYTRLSRADQDFAVFGELAYDILPNLTLNVGLRYFTVDNTLRGFSGFVSDVLSEGSAVCTPMTGVAALPHPGVATIPDPGDVPCGDVDKEVKEQGETHKINLSWKIDPHRMVYFTYSTGFRPGGVNRKPVAPPYNPDTISNFEIGWKTTWLDGRLRFNGALFDEEWSGVQYALSPPGSQGVTYIFNAGQARSTGVEGDIVWRPDDHWTLSGSGTVLDAHLTKTFENFDSSGNVTESAPAGTPLPIQPKYKLNGSVRYDFLVFDFKSFWQASVQTQGASTSALFTDNEATLGPTKAFTTVDLAAGFGKDNWLFQVFVQNVFDSRGQLSINTDCAIVYCGPYALIYPTKPRMVGIKFGAKY